MGIAVLFIYIVVIFIAAKNGLTKVDSSSFFVNDRKNGAVGVACSILVSCVGASATLGMIGMAFSLGTPAFWWLGMGAVGLTALSVFLAGAVRDTGAYTMPQLVEKLLGETSRPLISIVITFAWMGILAAQFTAASQILQGLTGFTLPLCLAIAFILIVGHTMGGQAAVMRTDKVQAVVLLAALGLILFWLNGRNPGWVSAVEIQAVNEAFPPAKLVYYLIVVGANYLVCPMLFSRILSARDGKSARRGGLLAALGLLLCAAVICSIGLACVGLLPVDTPVDSVLTTALPAIMPEWMHVVVMIALLSAIISSADSCLFTAGSVLSHDLLQKDSLFARRAAIGVLGLAGLLVSLMGKGIIGFLFMAYDIYACGVVAPVFIAIVLRKRVAIDSRFACAAVAIGGVCGLCSALLEMPDLSYFGLGSSAAIALAGARIRAGVRGLAPLPTK